MGLGDWHWLATGGLVGLVEPEGAHQGHHLLLERHRKWLAWAQQDQDVWQVRSILGPGAGAADSPWHEVNEAVKELVHVEPKGDRTRELGTVLRLLLLADQLAS